MLHTLRFSLQNAVYFTILPFFGSCIFHILHTGCAKIQIFYSGAQRVIGYFKTVTLASTNNALPDEGLTKLKHVFSVLM
jgi:hypothetical protein